MAALRCSSTWRSDKLYSDLEWQRTCCICFTGITGYTSQVFMILGIFKNHAPSLFVASYHIQFSTSSTIYSTLKRPFIDTKGNMLHITKQMNKKNQYSVLLSLQWQKPPYAIGLHVNTEFKLTNWKCCPLLIWSRKGNVNTKCVQESILETILSLSRKLFSMWNQIFWTVTFAHFTILLLHDYKSNRFIVPREIC